MQKTIKHLFLRSDGLIINLDFHKNILRGFAINVFTDDYSFELYKENNEIIANIVSQNKKIKMFVELSELNDTFFVFNLADEKYAIASFLEFASFLDNLLDNRFSDIFSIIRRKITEEKIYVYYALA